MALVLNVRARGSDPCRIAGILAAWEPTVSLRLHASGRPHGGDQQSEQQKDTEQ
jgi:hypothetical protein